MNLLLDTHVFLWWDGRGRGLSEAAGALGQRGGTSREGVGFSGQRGSASRAAAGALRIGRTVTAALSEQRVLARTDSRLVATVGLVLLAIAVVGAVSMALCFGALRGRLRRD